MRRNLKRHPDSRCEAVKSITVDVVRSSSGNLMLRYTVTGVISDFSLPPMAASARADELWRHTCFEAFVRTGLGYYEFNFAPSMQWAAYRFDGYRRGMRAVRQITAPRIGARVSGTRYELRVSLALDRLPDLSRRTLWRLGLSAVIEEANGRKSYWALAHPPGKPDFHHSGSSALLLSRACCNDAHSSPFVTAGLDPAAPQRSHSRAIARVMDGRLKGGHDGRGLTPAHMRFRDRQS